MPPIAPAGSRMRLLPSCAAALSRAEQRGIGERSDRDHQAIDAAAQHLLAVLGDGLLAGDLGNDRRAAREQIRERFDDVDAAERRARLHRRDRHAPARRRSRTPFAGSSLRSAATTSCAIPPQPIRPTEVMAVLMR